MPPATTRTLMAAAVLGTLLEPAALADTTSLQVYGPGGVSCATYLQDRSLRINADGWILGYWTGLNTASENQLVGKSTDSRGIVAQVATVCRAQPAVPLYKTTKQVYDQMKAGGT